MEEIKNEENYSKIYKSNVTVGSMNFFEQLDRTVAILAINNNKESITYMYYQRITEYSKKRVR